MGARHFAGGKRQWMQQHKATRCIETGSLPEAGDATLLFGVDGSGYYNKAKGTCAGRALSISD